MAEAGTPPELRCLTPDPLATRADMSLLPDLDTWHCEALAVSGLPVGVPGKNVSDLQQQMGPLAQYMPRSALLFGANADDSAKVPLGDLCLIDLFRMCVEN